MLNIENAVHRFECKGKKQWSLNKMNIYVADMENVKDWKTEELENPYIPPFFQV